MVHVYFDTSALVKRYHPEIGSEIVDELIESDGSVDRVTSFWSALEFVSAFGAKKKRREITLPEMKIGVANFVKEIEERFSLRGVDDEMVARAMEVAQDHGLASGDSLHLATLLELKSFLSDAHETLVFVCADDELCRAAEREKITVVNPRLDRARKDVAELLRRIAADAR